MVFARTYTYTFEEFKNKDLIKEMDRVENLLNHIKNKLIFFFDHLPQ